MVEERKNKSDFALPLLEWLAIPAGQVLIEKGYGEEDYFEDLIGPYHVEQFAIAKYPVTNAQFQAFLDAPDGYRDIQWWAFSVSARAWRQSNPMPARSPFNDDTHPRVCTCWFEAIAFCRWLSHWMGETIRLPTELEWQWAAQGNDNRAYPWGNEFDRAKCNTSVSRISQTTSVDKYPSGQSPFGVYDMTGNVWEWCHNDHFKLHNSVIADVVSPARRGSSWHPFAAIPRITFRHYWSADYRSSDTGFRLLHEYFG